MTTSKMIRDEAAIIESMVPRGFVKVSKKQFYSAIGPVPNLMTGCFRHWHPVDYMEFRVSYYEKTLGRSLGDWKIWGVHLSLPLGPRLFAKDLCYMSEYAIDQFIIFGAEND